MRRLEFKTIGEVSEVISGSTPKTSVAENWNGNIKWITPTDLGDGHNWYIAETERKITDVGLKDAGLKILPRGTVLLTSRAPIGKVAIAATEMCTNQGFKNIVCNSNILNNEYLYFYLLGKKNYLNSLGRGATFKEISKTIVEGIKIPLPPLETQKKIAAVLDKAQELIDKRKEQLAKMDEFVQSVYLEMFGDAAKNTKGWIVNRIEQFAAVETGATPSRDVSSYYNGGKIPWVKTTEVKGCYIYETEEFITDKAIIETNCKVFPEFTIIIAMYGQGKTRGRVGLLRLECSTNQACAAILPSSSFNPIFLFSQLKNRYEEIRSFGRGGSQPNLNLSIIKNFQLILPPIELQNQFATIVEKTEQQKALMQQSLTEMENNMSSLMQRAFKGELF